MDQPCALVLSDGTYYNGYSFGALAPTVAEVAALDGAALDPVPAAIGEVVFNTAMAGYHEVLTDPSYTGQLVAMTYPHVGNYGCDEAWNEVGPGRGNRCVQPAAMIARSLYRGPVPEGRVTLDQFLGASGIPGITGVDTRRLTLSLRQGGSQNGALVRPEGDGPQLSESEISQVVEALHAFPQMLGRNLIGSVGAREVMAENPEGSPHIVLVDCGLKANIVRLLVARGCRVSVVPSTADAESIDAIGGDALFVSNGPGDPAVLTRQIDLIRAQIGKRPLLGICLGHQLIAEAMGAKTHKMKFGHHGVNHPVRDERTGRVFVTSQNHGFSVDEKSLPPGCDVWFRNANDGSIEGLADDNLRVKTSQFHPEAAPGPHDAEWIFDAFLETVAMQEEE